MTNPTQRPLRAMVPDILEYVRRRFESNIVFSQENLDILNGGLKKYVEESIRKEILSKKSLSVMLERITPINTLKQTVNKLSKVYTDGANRETDEPNQEFVDYVIQSTGLNSVLGQSNKMYNLHKYLGLEPYLDYDGSTGLRVLDASVFIPYSDDPFDPTRMTVSIKWQSTIQKAEPFIDEKGNKVSNPKDVIRNVKIYYLSSSTEFLIIDSDGEIRDDLMAKAGIPNGLHSTGMIPIILIKEVSSALVPAQDSSMRDMAISISKKLTDLSFATLYQSHSMFYGIDVDVSGLDSNPDTFLDIKSDPGDPSDPKSPQIGILQPKVNIPETLELIEAELALHLQSMGLTVGQGASGNTIKSVASGVSKLIDEAGAEQSLREQRQMYKQAEEKGLWKLFAALQNIWTDNNSSKYDKRVDPELEVVLTFVERKPTETEEAVVDKTIKQLDNGLITKRRALMQTNPDIANNKNKIDELIKELEEEANGSSTKDNDKVTD